MKFIFGPVASRRLGKSLGIDLIPFKTCSFDCLYCELGRTTNRTIERKEYISPQIILKNFREYLEKLDEAPDYITLSGSGEPTLHSKIALIISEIKNITSIPVAILTNGSILYQDEVKKDLLEADVVLPSLDTVTPSIFKYLNRPHPSLAIEKIIEGLKEFRKSFPGEIWVEILLCLGVNDNKNEIEKIKNILQEINPDKIQLNSVDRPPAEDFVFPLDLERLEEIKLLIGAKAEIISKRVNQESKTFTKQLLSEKERVFSLLKRRPCTLEDISRALGIQRVEIAKILDLLRKEDKVHYRIFNNQCYYQAH